MSRLAIGMSILMAMGTMGSLRAADDSIQLIDSTDLESFMQLPEVPDIGDLLVGATVDNGAEAMLSGVSARQGRAIKLVRPRTTPNGFRLGVEISFDDGDQIELRDSDRLYLEGAFGRVRDYDGLSVQSGSGLLPTTIGYKPGMDRGLDSVALLSRASALNESLFSLALAVPSPSAGGPHYAGVRLGYSTRERLIGNPVNRGLDIALTSMVMTHSGQSDGLNYLDGGAVNLRDRAYNVGLNVGFRGFTFAASFLRGESELSATYQSYDVGFSYDWGHWATSLALGGYFASQPTIDLSSHLDIDHIYSVEIGASYAVRPWLRVQGRLQVYDYHTFFGSTVDGLGGTLYLGTSLGF